MTILRDVVAARNRAFGTTLELDYAGPPLSLEGARISLQVRLYAGAPGAPLAADENVSFVDGVNPDDPGRRILAISPDIARATLAAMPTGLNQPEFGEADRFEYEITLTYADGDQDTLWIGAFFLTPGVDRT
ncbi:hypothetical protein [Sphingomonas echinoides]|uniref:Uncharacterized protein n=1 Tax=Sphingomonas echinoides TaxID=59803 RepID=A0ABU4PKH7_9SPHN|nr:hypothetical protein [Sphingomonas echinoides]MDX5984703.1 hypothetical protein [Sphingomonas echinoides]